MKRFIPWVLLTVLCTGALVLTACSSDTTSPLSPNLATSSSQQLSGGSSFGAAGEALGAEAFGTNSGFLCSFTFEGITYYTRDSRSVETSSGKEILSCQGQVPADRAPPYTTIVTGERCTMASGETTFNTKLVVTKSGGAKLTCKQ